MSSPATWSWTHEQTIPSRTAAAAEVVDALLAQLRRDEWEPHDVFGVHLAVEEALVNAITHGNKEDPQKSVSVILQSSPQRLRVEIIDEGSGFEPALVPDPTCDACLNQPHGRGLMLIRWFMSDVKYLGSGNHLVMEKERTT
ncbi:MAG TPA: ATP-binding protein [Pirellulaceae bacterium]|jgi:serine/threonine-protein kinase RsbW|nr:ATP-binding protein [Pirellulaceae bacterium]